MPNYSAQDIQILKGLEHVRKRPAMYIGDTGMRGYHHLLREVVDNAIDEYLDGHVTKLQIKINTETQVVTVQDNGRGIPVSKHPKAGISTLTAVFMKLHTGGKFGRGAYTAAVAGLHGIGVKAVNALSTELEVCTRRNGKVWQQTFCRGEPTSAVKQSKRKLQAGTFVQFRPDAEIFKATKWKPARIKRWLHDVAYLCPGLIITLDVDGAEECFTGNGLADLIAAAVGDCKSLSDIIVVKTTDFEAAIVWTDLEGEHWRSWVNIAQTPSHGTHVAGLRRALADVLNQVEGGDRYRGEDLREGLVGAIHARVLEPQFRGQTKTRLENSEVDTLVYDAACHQLQRYFLEHPSIVQQVVARAHQLQEARQRYRAEQQAIKGTKVKKGARGILPGKLVEAPDCLPTERELFVVEGSSAEQGPTKARVTIPRKGQQIHFQEIYPLRGKLTNAARKSDLASVVKNQSIKDLFTAIGTGIGDTFDLRKCRYNAVYLLADADPDGRHIVALLLALFVRHMPDLIKADMVRVVLNPLFMGVSAKKRVYGNTVSEVKAQFGSNEKIHIRRFKGLGESNPEELQEYALDPRSRKVLRVIWNELDNKLVLSYMGVDSGVRKDLLEIVE